MDAKQLAAEKAVDYVKSGMVVGLGTGSTAKYAIIKIGSMVKQGLQIKAIATSLQSETLAKSEGINITSFAEVKSIDITIDGADEADAEFNLIKGGGGALLHEKIVAAASKFYVIVVDEKKLVTQLGKFPLPVEVIPFGWEVTKQKLLQLDCTTKLRYAGKIPFVTDSGHYIIDCHFSRINDPETLHTKINNIPGVVENGLFLQMADEIIVGYTDGNLKTMKRNDIE
ncbi:MAG: ribose-5-phosphate isomerase RpiA [Chitinophagales bacterium]|nr:ribose-5-phosphate isomerase RpiA [Chitinophagales bacterium]